MIGHLQPLVVADQPQCSARSARLEKPSVVAVVVGMHRVVVADRNCSNIVVLVAVARLSVGLIVAVGYWLRKLTNHYASHADSRMECATCNGPLCLDRRLMTTRMGKRLVC